MERTIVLRVLTRCTTVDQFVDTFRRLSTDTSVFVPTRNQREVGVETAFSIRLAGGSIVLSGLGEIASRFETSANEFGKPGILVEIRRLTAESQPVFDRMRMPPEALDAPEGSGEFASERTIPGENDSVPDVIQPATTNKIAASGAQLADMVRPTMQMPPLFSEERTPGSPIIVPANPLTAETGLSLEAFIDHAMCECDEAAAPHDEAVPSEATTAPLAARSQITTTLGFAPLAPATAPHGPVIFDTQIPRWPRATAPDNDRASIAALVLEATSAPLETTASSSSLSPSGGSGGSGGFGGFGGRHERTAMVALDRDSGEPQPGPWAAFRSRLAKTVRGVAWWLRRRRTTDRVRIRTN